MELNFVETVNTLNPFSIRLDKYNNVNSSGFTWIFRNEMLVLRFQKVIYRWKACTKVIIDIRIVSSRMNSSTIHRYKTLRIHSNRATPGYNLHYHGQDYV